jgi:hypothetical protein
MAHYELHAWCLLVLGWVFAPFYMRSRVFTMPEFLERRFSPAARWVLSIISLVAYVLTKIAVGIFAGGVVFATLLPELQLQVGRTTINSFWVGIGHRAAADRRLHGPWRAARGGLHGRCRRWCSCRLDAADVLRPARARRVGRAAGGARPRDVQPLEADHPGRRAGDVGAGERAGRAWRGTSTATTRGRHAASRADHRAVVLVHRPVHRAARARRAQRGRGAPRHDLRRVPQAAAGLHLHHPGHDRAGAGADGPRAGLLERWWARRAGHPAGRAGGVPAARAERDAGRPARHRRGGTAGGAHELARRRVQRELDALHDGLLPEAAPGARPRSSSSGSVASRRR